MPTLGQLNRSISVQRGLGVDWNGNYATGNMNNKIMFTGRPLGESIKSNGDEVIGLLSAVNKEQSKDKDSD